MADHKGTRLYRFPEDDLYPKGGSIYHLTWDRLLRTELRGFFYSESRDQVRRLVAMRRLAFKPGQTPYLNMFIGIPEEVITAHSRAVTYRYLTWMIISLLASIILAWLIGKFGIHDRVMRLATVAQRLGSGDLTARSGLPLGNGSIGELAIALDDMAEALQQQIQTHIEMENRLRESHDEAESANKAKSEFLANMSHEIRTPLNGILGMLQILQGSVLNEEQKGYASMAIQSSRRLTTMLSDILDLSRIEAGKLNIVLEPFNLPETMRQVFDLFQPIVKQSGVGLNLEIDPAIPHRLTGDAVRLHQVLTNLVGNAFKFTRAGSITIQASILPEMHPGEARVLFSIADTGIGIPDSALASIFEPFTQATEGFRREHQGAGLGLAICKRLIGLMGGHIAMDSEDGKGTTVYFSLIFKQSGNEMAQPMATGDEKPSYRSLNILLAEDDQVSRLSLRKQMEMAGCAVLAVENGWQALETLRNHSFDAVLMDIQMPVMDGVEATRAIRSGQAGEDKKHVPIIAITAYAMTGDKEKFIEAGMNGYLAKPAEMDALKTILADITRLAELN